MHFFPRIIFLARSFTISTRKSTFTNTINYQHFRSCLFSARQRYGNDSEDFFPIKPNEFGWAFRHRNNSRTCNRVRFICFYGFLAISIISISRSNLFEFNFFVIENTTKFWFLYALSFHIQRHRFTNERILIQLHPKHEWFEEMKSYFCAAVSPFRNHQARNFLLRVRFRKNFQFEFLSMIEKFYSTLYQTSLPEREQYAPEKLDEKFITLVCRILSQNEK